MSTDAEQQQPAEAPLSQRLWEVCLLFLRIGATGFGGPAVTIAMMEDEVVTRRQWLGREQFLDLVGATNLIPGPNAAEMAIHVGYLRAGWPGLLLAGLCFIVPAALITLAYAWAYVRYGALPAVAPLLEGVKPAVLAVIAGALWRLGGAALRRPAPDRRLKLAVMGLAVLVASLLGVNEVLALFAGGLAGMVWLQAGARAPRKVRGHGPLAALALPGLAQLGGPLAAATSQAGLTLARLALFFLKVGAVMYGSGYVLIAFLEGGLVRQYGWLTQQQLLDAVAAGQLTPGPLLSTATFIGYMLLGLPGPSRARWASFCPRLSLWPRSARCCHAFGARPGPVLFWMP